MRAPANNKSRRSKHSKKSHFQQQRWSPEIISHRWGKLQAQQQQRNNNGNTKAHKHVWGTSCPNCFFVSICVPKHHQILAHRWGIANNNATTNQQQVNNKCNNKTHKHVGGTSCLKCFFCFNLSTKMPPNRRTPLGKRQQQRHNNGGTNHPKSFRSVGGSSR